MSALRIDVQRLRGVIDRASATKAPSAGGRGRTPQARGPAGRMNTTISAAVIEETRAHHPNCTCEDLGLSAGMTIAQTQTLGNVTVSPGFFGDSSGCTDTRNGGGGKGVCPRLDGIRRRYGF